jgi:GDPmannose 4,6-dehydratase
VTTHLITGITGQDGVLLARLLRSEGGRVIGTCRPGSQAARQMAPYLEGVAIVEHDIRDTEGFGSLVSRHRPDTVVNLAAQSSVAASWDDPPAAHEVNGAAVERLVAELGRLGSSAPRFVQASSSEIFGPSTERSSLTDDQTPLNPVSPYAEGKATAHRAVAAAREAGLSASNLILFGHTSCLQTDQFVIPLIARQAAEVRHGRRDAITLRDPDVRRDWCSASDVARAFALAIAGPPGDFVIASGELHSLREISQWALDSVDCMVPVAASETATTRPRDFGGRIGDPGPAGLALGWKPTTGLDSEVARMVGVDLARLRTGVDQDPAYLSELFAGR